MLPFVLPHRPLLQPILGHCLQELQHAPTCAVSVRSGDRHTAAVVTSVSATTWLSGSHESRCGGMRDVKRACANMDDALIGRSLELYRRPSVALPAHLRTTASLDHAALLCKIVLHTLNNAYNSFTPLKLYLLKRPTLLHCSPIVRLTFMLPAPT